MKTDFSEVHIPDRFGGEGIGHHVAMIRLRDDPPKILIQSPKTHTFPGDKQRFWNGSKLYESDIVDSVVNSLTHESLHLLLYAQHSIQTSFAFDNYDLHDTCEAATRVYQNPIKEAAQP